MFRCILKSVSLSAYNKIKFCLLSNRRVLKLLEHEKRQNIFNQKNILLACEKVLLKIVLFIVHVFKSSSRRFFFIIHLPPEFPPVFDTMMCLKTWCSPVFHIHV